MTYSRHRLRMAAAIAWERSRYGLTPARARRARFLRSAVDWNAVGASPGDRRGLVDFVLQRKFDRVRYLVSGDDLQWFGTSDPFGNHADTCHRADAICEHRIDVTNFGTVQFGDRIEWRRDPVTDTLFPTSLFSVRPPSNVDERYRAEVNCHRHFPVLASAWLITREQRYARELVQQWRSWLERYPPIDDAFMNDGLETAVRVLCWTHCLFLLGAGVVDEGFCLDILARIATYGQLIEKNYKHGAHANNHQVAEAFGLLLIGVLYPELASSQHWRERGLALLEQQAQAQLLPGGVHVEQSAAYHLFVLEAFHLGILLCRRNNVVLPQTLLARVDEATDYLMHMLKPNGRLPDLGDDCGLRLFTPTGVGELQPRTALSVGAVLFDRPDRAAVAGLPSDDVFWRVGREGVAWLHAASQEAKPDTVIKVFPDAGHAIVRSGWDDESHYLHFDFGPQGLGARPGHGHDDVLSFELHARGQGFIVDAGTHTYLRSHPLRAYFVGARGHNTIIVDGEGSARIGGGSGTWSAMAGELRQSASGEPVSWLTVRHRGYAADARGVIVERSVLAVRGEYLLVVDRILGSGVHTVESLLHFHPAVHVSLEPEGAYCAATAADLRVIQRSSAETRRSLHRGDDATQPGWHSAHYGQVAEADVMRLEYHGSLPFWNVTGLFSGACGSVPPVRLTALPAVSDQGTEIVATVDGWSGSLRDVLVLRWAVDGADAQAGMQFMREQPDGWEGYAYRADPNSVHGTIARLGLPDQSALPFSVRDAVA